MTGKLRVWSVFSLIVSAALFLSASLLRADETLPFFRRPVIGIVQAVGAGLAVVALGILVSTFFARFGEDPPVRPGGRERSYLMLFAVSFVALFCELMLIRYAGSQIRIFSFYKNVPLIATFLGLGLGRSLGGGKPRHALLFLLWLVPLAAVLSAGSLVISQALGRHAAIGSSEQILGDFVPTAADRGEQWISQLSVAAFCVATFVAIALLFVLVGRLMGGAFENVARLPGYTVNIAGSLAGILTFIGLSYLGTPPWVWFAVGLLPLLGWLPDRRSRLAGAGLVLAGMLAVFPSYGDTVWSPYQKLVGHAGSSAAGGAAYLVEISDVFYQAAVDRRPAVLARTRTNPMPHYDAVYRAIRRPSRVLIVGAGTGNDVAAALRAGVAQVDAVEIDPAIVALGRDHHPERPYDDIRVKVIVDDARHVFHERPPGSYDAVVFGLLDSHTQLGMSSVRLDNYVFTQESFDEARRLVRPGGHVIVTAATFDEWFRSRIEDLLRGAVQGPVNVLDHGLWKSYIAEVRDTPDETHRAGTARRDLPSDDWPFLYLPRRTLPAAYIWVVACLVVASIVVLRVGGLPIERWSLLQTHMFLLGAAFLLMEVHAINRLALLFGTTWLVSGVTIAIVLLLIVAANLTVMLLPRLPYSVAYGGLALALAASYGLGPSSVVGLGLAAELAIGFVLLSPVYFAGLVFGRSLGIVPQAAPAIGANILGSVLGGWAEYSTMAIGIRALVLLAAGFYGLSLLALVFSRAALPPSTRRKPA